MNMIFEKKLTIPKEVKEMYPLDAESAKIVEQRNAEVRDIFEGKSDKLVLVIGPCSADREDSVLDYITRLREVQEKVKDKVFIIPRIYTNKPRTTGAGYKGMLHQPDPEAKPDMFKGIIAILSSTASCTKCLACPMKHCTARSRRDAPLNTASRTACSGSLSSST